MKMYPTIILGDSRNMSEIKDESVHLIVTSPPYWQLKDYGNGSQIGFNDSYEDYINNLNLVWKECYRVLHNGCRLCINIGDQFARSVYYGRYKIIPIREEIIRFCETIGFDYMGAIIWQKVTTCNTTGGATIMGSFPYPRNGIIKLDYEFILIFKKLGDPPKVSREIKEKSKLTTEEWNEYFYGHWNFPGERQDKHLAMFPEELPKRLIKMFSFVGDTVLDPFLGSGTTCLAAKNLNRNSIGYEINKDFLSAIKEKIKGDISVIAQEKKGMPTGLTVTHPISGEQVPVWVGNYVQMSYGEGAVMGVPGHDERDYAFALKYQLPIKCVIRHPAGDTVPEPWKAEYAEYGSCINSGKYDGLAYEAAVDAIAADLADERRH